MKKSLLIAFTLIGFANNFAFGVELINLPIPKNRSSDIYCVTKKSPNNGYCFALYDSADGAVNKMRRIDNLTNNENFAKVCFGCLGYDGTSMKYGGAGNLYIEYFHNDGNIDELSNGWVPVGSPYPLDLVDFNKVQRGIGYLENSGTIGEIGFGLSRIGIRKIENRWNIGTISPGYDKDGIFELINRKNIKTIENDISRSNTIIYNSGTIDSILFKGDGVLDLDNRMNGIINNINGYKGATQYRPTITINGSNYGTIKNIGGEINLNIDNFSNRVSEGEAIGTIDKILNNSRMNIKIVSGYDLYGNEGIINNIENNGTMNIEIDNTEIGTIGKIYNSDKGTMNLTLRNKRGAVQVDNQGIVGDIENYGTMNVSISNFGIMNGIDNKGKMDLRFYVPISGDTYKSGTINLVATPTASGRYYHIGNANVTIDGYSFTINESADEFNNFKGHTTVSSNTTSHLVIHNSSDLSFTISKDTFIAINATNAELNKIYFLDKFFTDTFGNSLTEQIGYEWNENNLARKGPNDSKTVLHYKDGKLYGIEFCSVYDATCNGSNNNNNITPTPSVNTNILTGQMTYKANIKAMNNLYINSNSMIFKHKYSNKMKSKRRIAMNLSQDSGESIKENATFYHSYPQDSRESMDLYSAYNPKKSKSNKSTNPKSANFTTNNSQPTQSPYNNDKYHFAFVPFVSHSIFSESSGYNLSGFDYGFITAFSGMIDSNNALGVHFGISNGKLQDRNIDSLNIISLNLMGGLNYKLDLIYDMYIKMRGDVFYLINIINKNMQTIYNQQTTSIKSNNLGFGASVAYGKDFDFKVGGVLGLEIGIDYKGLNNGAFSIKSIVDDSDSDESYKKSLYSMIYADLGISYYKYFDSGFGFSVGGGFRANLAPKLAKGKLAINGTHYDMTIDNDKYLGYASAGLGYTVYNANSTIEFSINYNGNFGDRTMNNAGMFDFRVLW